jgi:diguanylate cyclase (GGDEF)-like protein
LYRVIELGGCAVADDMPEELRMNSRANRRILLIDDTPAIHEDFRKILQNDAPEASELDAINAALFGEEAKTARARFELDSAYQGQEGVAKVGQALQAGRPYGMAFVDMRMPPGLDGVDTIDALWQKDPRLQIVICTAYTDYSWEEVLDRLDVRDRLLVLKKPFDSVEVYQLASALTAKWDMTQQAAAKMAVLEEAVRARTAELSKANAVLQEDIVARERAEALRTEHGRIIEMIATSTPLEQVLESLMVLTESQMAGTIASILLLDDDGEHLRCAAAPNLPEAYSKSIDGIAIGPQAGSCGTAMHRRQPVIVADILDDPLWDEYRAAATPHGLRSCWSFPILSHHGAMLGTFAVYSGDVRQPTPAERQVIDTATHIAGIAIERKQAEDRIRHMAHHDALTGVPNRILLHDRLNQAILYAQRYDRQVTAIFIDLDNFKLINDSLGHNVGDELLKVIATRMLQSVRRTDTVARLGGDEFVIVLFGQPAGQQTEALAPLLEKLRHAIAQPVHIGEHRLHVTCSMGVASYPRDADGVHALLMNADAAMYRAKELGRNSYEFYSGEMNTKSQEKLTLQDGLREAIARNELMLLYQPQVDLRSGQITGVEALIRWQHPELGMVSPVTFIPLAEETGLIVPIGEWVLRTACRQNKAWQDAGTRPIIVSVNVSARQFKEGNLVERVARALRETGLEARYLELELTESLIMQNLQLAVATMRDLQAMGVWLSIDDFGTGYSSLSALKSFPIVRLKIDRSFVRDIPGDEDDKAITTAMISLGHKLNLKVVAEGVETDGQLAFLRDNECDEMQGYHFSRPVPVAEIENLLRRPEQIERSSGSGARVIRLAAGGQRMITPPY